MSNSSRASLFSTTILLSFAFLAIEKHRFYSDKTETFFFTNIFFFRFRHLFIFTYQLQKYFLVISARVVLKTEKKSSVQFLKLIFGSVKESSVCKKLSRKTVYKQTTINNRTAKQVAFECTVFTRISAALE